MGIAEEAVTRLVPQYPDLGVLARRPGVVAGRPGLLRRLDHQLGQRRAAQGDAAGPVAAVRLSIEGIRGGRTETRTIRCTYLLIVDVSTASRQIPAVWVRSPADSAIEHVNIWPAAKSFCPWTGAWLPNLCWNTFAAGWMAAAPAHRTLGTVLEYAKQLLNTENHDSPAR